MNPHRINVNDWLGLRVRGAQLDDDGMACLSVDEDTAVIIEVPEDGEVCHFFAPVSALDADRMETELLRALELNRLGRPLGGCWLAWDPDFAMLTLCYNLVIPGADAISFSNTVDNFIAALREARRAMAGDKIDPWS